MKRVERKCVMIALVIGWATMAPARADEPPKGFTSLFNGKDMSGWKVPDGDNGHWKVVDGVIDYDALSEGKEKDLWTNKEYGDFVLLVDWRIPKAAGEDLVPIVLSDGSYKTGADGKVIYQKVPAADSGIYLRGNSKSQVNIWRWPVGSGEVYGYRTDAKMPPEVRAGVTPKLAADKPIGEWNHFKITMAGDRLSVELNGQTVIERAQLPGVPEKGRIGLQHHGGMHNGKLHAASSLVQFRNIYIKEL